MKSWFRLLLVWLIVSPGLPLCAQSLNSGLEIQSPAGEPIGGGENATLLSSVYRAQYYWTRGGSSGHTISFRRFGDYSDAWNFVFYPLNSAILKTGTFPVSSGYSPPPGGFVVHLTKHNVLVPSFQGTCEIRQADYGADGSALRLWIVLDLTATGAAQPFHAEIRYVSSPVTPAANQSPFAFLETPQPAQLGLPVTLRARPWDDGLPSGSTLSLQWEVLNASPTTATFSAPTEATTDVTFHQPGEFSVRLSVSDGDKTYTDTRVLFIAPPATHNLLHFSALSATASRVAKEEVLLINPAASRRSWYFFEELGFSTGRGVTVTATPPDILNLPVGQYYYPRAQHPTAPLTATERGDIRKFELRFPSQPRLGAEFPALWLTFAVYGFEDEPIGLGEARMNVPPAAVIDAPPIVDAGPDRELTRLSLYRLHGAAMGIQGASTEPVTIQWSQVSGPGQITFADPAASSTDVTFSVPGVYQVRLTATQGARATSDDTTVTVYPGETSLTLRERTRFSGQALFLDPQGYEFAVVADTEDKIAITCERRGYDYDDPARYYRHFEFRAPPGEKLTAGRYSVYDQSAYPTGPFLSVASGSATYNMPGRFQLLELSRDEQGKLLSLRVRFEVGALNETAEYDRLQGELRYRADAPSDAPNAAPAATAGPNQVLTTSLSTDLVGDVSDDLLPLRQQVHTSWQQISGPAPASFRDSQPRTRVSFPEPGTYVLRLTATDGALTSSSDVTIVVRKPMPMTYRGFATFEGSVVGIFQARVLPSGQFTATMIIQGQRISVPGRLSDGTSSRSFPLTNGGTLRVGVQREAGDLYLTASFDFGTDVFLAKAAQVSGAFLQASRTTSPAAGRYTWISDEPEGDTHAPHAFSFGTAQVTPQGVARFVGRLAGGRVVSYGAPLSAENGLDLFWVHQRREIVAGELQFRASDPDYPLLGGLAWSRRKAGKQPAFFTTFNLLGARYQVPTAKQNPVTLEEAPVTLELGGAILPDGTPQMVTFDLPASASRAVAPGVQFQIDRRTGLFRGTLRDSENRLRTYQGALLQGRGIGGGWYPAGKQTGSVVLSRGGR